jgi:gephyrin
LRTEWHANFCCGCCACCRPPEGAGLPTDPVWFATTTGNQISSRLLSARSANALLELPRQAGVLPAGSKVSALLIDDLCHMPVDPASITPTPGFDG